jgi:hypothetical protein
MITPYRLYRGFAIPVMLATVFLFVLATPLRSQDSFVCVHGTGDGDSLRYDATDPNPVGNGEKLLWLGAASLSFSLFDYVGFNLVRNSSTHTLIYRVLHVAVQAGMSWLLYDKLGLPTAVAFNLMWWTWGLDALFYGYTELFNRGGGWSGRGAFRKDIMQNNCTWASWTPVGIARGMDNSKPIAGDTLVAQFLLGAVAAITVTITF